jgi:hypothetical protein
MFRLLMYCSSPRSLDGALPTRLRGRSFRENLTGLPATWTYPDAIARATTLRYQSRRVARQQCADNSSCAERNRDATAQFALKSCAPYSEKLCQSESYFLKFLLTDLWKSCSYDRHALV